MNQSLRLVSCVVLCCFTTTTLGWARGAPLHTLHPRTAISAKTQIERSSATDPNQANPVEKQKGNKSRFIVRLAIGVVALALGLAVWQADFPGVLALGGSDFRDTVLVLSALSASLAFLGKRLLPGRPWSWERDFSRLNQKKMSLFFAVFILVSMGGLGGALTVLPETHKVFYTTLVTLLINGIIDTSAQYFARRKIDFSQTAAVAVFLGGPNGPSITAFYEGMRWATASIFSQIQWSDSLERLLAGVMRGIGAGGYSIGIGLWYVYLLKMLHHYDFKTGVGSERRGDFSREAVRQKNKRINPWRFSWDFGRHIAIQLWDAETAIQVWWACFTGGTPAVGLNAIANLSGSVPPISKLLHLPEWLQRTKKLIIRKDLLWLLLVAFIVTPLSYFLYPGKLRPAEIEVVHPPKEILSTSGKMTYITGHDPATRFSLAPVDLGDGWKEGSRYLSFQLVVPPSSNIPWLTIGDRTFYPDKGLQKSVIIDTKPYRKRSPEGLESIELPVALGIREEDQWYELALSNQNWLYPVLSVWTRFLVFLSLISGGRFLIRRFVVSLNPEPLSTDEADFSSLAAQL